MWRWGPLQPQQVEFTSPLVAAQQGSQEASRWLVGTLVHTTLTTMRVGTFSFAEEMLPLTPMLGASCSTEAVAVLLCKT